MEALNRLCELLQYAELEEELAGVLAAAQRALEQPSSATSRATTSRGAPHAPARRRGRPPKPRPAKPEPLRPAGVPLSAWVDGSAPREFVFAYPGVPAQKIKVFAAVGEYEAGSGLGAHRDWWKRQAEPMYERPRGGLVGVTPPPPKAPLRVNPAKWERAYSAFLREVSQSPCFAAERETFALLQDMAAHLDHHRNGR
jgi:hypothetical protein